VERLFDAVTTAEVFDTSRDGVRPATTPFQVVLRAIVDGREPAPPTVRRWAERRLAECRKAIGRRSEAEELDRLEELRAKLWTLLHELATGSEASRSKVWERYRTTPEDETARLMNRNWEIIDRHLTEPRKYRKKPSVEQSMGCRFDNLSEEVRALCRHCLAVLSDPKRRLTNRLGECGWCGHFHFSVEGRPIRFCNGRHRGLFYDDRRNVAARVRRSRQRRRRANA
jgi:hypothetical protein